jgi:hypothetical protein
MLASQPYLATAALSNQRPTSQDIDPTPFKVSLLYEKSSLINSAFSFFLF